MMADFRKERVGITNAARLLGVSVTQLKDAIHHDGELKGVTLPKPIKCGGSNIQFFAGDIMDCAESIKCIGRE